MVYSVGKHYLGVTDQGKDYPTLLIVIISNTLANNFEMENGISSYSQPTNDKLLAEQGLTPADTQELVDETRESLYLAKEVLYN